LPARGGTSPESQEEVRQHAPQAFRTKERAVTTDDYAEVIQRHPQVQKAAATRRWTGSWYTMFISVDFKGGLALTPQMEDKLRDFLEKFRLAGHDVEIDEPQFVPLDIIMTVCVKEGYFRSQVKQALLETFSRYDLSNGRRGFFHPDNFTFGQPVYLSQIIATTMDVPGVKWVDLNDHNGSPHRFQRWGRSPNNEIALGQINISRLEIAQLDNDPSQPENGKIEFLMEGGL
jgi:predicted phage baseplate assembly protein